MTAPQQKKALDIDNLKNRIREFATSTGSWAKENPEAAGAIAGGVGGAGLGALAGGRGRRVRGALMGGIPGAAAGYGVGRLYGQREGLQEDLSTQKDETEQIKDRLKLEIENILANK